MKHNDLTSSGKPLGTDWQILGELKLPLGSDSDEMISVWLQENLRPLSLLPDFISKILKSAEDATSRAMAASAAVIVKGRIHLFIFVPLAHQFDGRTWGFFRIEKLESAEQGQTPPDHSIEFFLYIEGQ